MENKTDYSFLQPVKVGGREFKNRIIYPAMGKHLASEDGYVTDEYIEYFRSVAKGGVAALVTGIQVIDPTWHYISSRQTWICDDKFIPGLSKLVESVHNEDCLIFFQPWHSGQAGQPAGSDGSKPLTCNDFSIEKIHEIQEMWFQAARRAKAAGADGIEFHCAHLYLPSQFMSPYFNHRSDEYGSGTIEDSMRFSTEIISRIDRELADDSFMVIAKMNGDDFVEGGTDIKRAVKAARLLEKAGAKMLTVNGGGVLTKVEAMSDNGAHEEGWKVHLAEAVKQAVNIPVAASGSLRHPSFVDQIIRDGHCDLAAIGRGIFAEREWVKKCIEGREDEMRYCISCMYCFTIAPDGTSGCSVNPFAKRELEKPELQRDGGGRSVLVIGAGPSGLETAVTLAERGFDVTIIEKENRIGGLVAYAEMPPDKYKLGWMLDYYENQISRLSIKLRLGVTASEELIDSLHPYAVIFAMGSHEFVPNVKGVDYSDTISVREAFDMAAETKDLSGDTVIIGAGLTGIELGRLISSRGGKVRIFEIMPKPESMVLEMKLALKAAAEDGIEITYRMAVTAIGNNEVTLRSEETGELTSFHADRIIRSMGIRSENQLFSQLQGAGKPYITAAVGDCAKTGKISTAVQSGADAAFSLK